MIDAHARHQFFGFTQKKMSLTETTPLIGNKKATLLNEKLYVNSDILSYCWRLAYFFISFILVLIIFYSAFFTSHGIAFIGSNDKESFFSKDMQPNIIWIVADDVGFGDLSYNGAEYSTKNIDSLMKQGIVLNKHYVQPLCSPTRAGFLSGRYPFRYGFQFSDQDKVLPGTGIHIPVDSPIISETIKQYGYKTYAYG